MCCPRGGSTRSDPDDQSMMDASHFSLPFSKEFDFETQRSESKTASASHRYGVEIGELMPKNA